MNEVSPASLHIDERRPLLSVLTVQGILAAIAFASLLVSSNAMHPLLPVFRQTLGLDPLETTLTFVTYVGVLCLTLLVLSQPRLVRWSPQFLCMALVTAALGDVVLASPSVRGLMIGRALTGVAGGLGTGSGSALVVAALGARGRAVSATGNLAGAVIGTSLTELCIVLFGARAARVVFLGHAAASLALLVLLVPVLLLSRDTNRAALHTHGAATLRSLAPVLRERWVYLTIGCLSWVTISLSMSLLPSFFTDAGGGGPAIATGIVAYLFSSALGQMLSAPLARIAPWLSGIYAMTAGTALIPLAALVGHPTFALLGFPMLGFGTGMAYRLSLVMLTRGSDPNQQGALASMYGATTYGAATVGSLGAGLVGNLAGLRATVIATYLLGAIASVWLSRRAPRLRDDRRV